MDRSTGRPQARALYDSPQQEAYLQLWRTYDRLREIEERLFGGHAITAQQYNALRVLQSAGGRPMAVSALGSRLVSRAPDMTRMLDKLEEKALIHRRRDGANRRVVEVSIAPAGTALLRQLAPLVRRCGQDQLGHMSDADLGRLVSLLREARRPHEAHAQDAWPGNRE
jgi:DNA-binding MarR family transcriptional regulator